MDYRDFFPRVRWDLRPIGRYLLATTPLKVLLVYAVVNI